MSTRYKVWIQLERIEQRINDSGEFDETYEDDGLPDAIFHSESRQRAIEFIRKLPGWKMQSKTSDYREFPRRPDIQDKRRRTRETESI